MKALFSHNTNFNLLAAKQRKVRNPPSVFMICPRQAAPLIMCPGSNARCSCHASPQQWLRYFATLSVGDVGGGREGAWEGESCIPATSALQDTRRQTTIIQERETEGDSSTAKYSALPVSFVLSLSPPPLCPRLLPSLHTGTLSVPDVLGRFLVA